MTQLHLILIGVVFVIFYEIFWRRKNGYSLRLNGGPASFNAERALKIGPLLFGDKASQYEEYITLYAHDRAAFKMKYGDEFEDLGIEFDDITLIDLVTSFGVEEKKIYVVDWRGEENEGEVQAFCERILGKPIAWNAVKELKDVSRNNTIQLFESINKDLNRIGHQLARMNSANDTYELLVISIENFLALEKIEKGLVITRIK